jgi:hypothetical protein
VTTLNTICVQAFGLLGTDVARRRSETMLVGTDVSMFVAVFRPLAMIVLLSFFCPYWDRQTRNDYLTDNISEMHIFLLLNTTFRELRNSVLYIAKRGAQKACHSYNLKMASIELASLTQSNYNFSFQTCLIKVMSAVAAVAVLSGCEQQINDLFSHSLSHTTTDGRSVSKSWCRSTWHCCPSVSGRPLSTLPVCQQSAVSDFVAYLHARAHTHTHTHTHLKKTNYKHRSVDGV